MSSNEERLDSWKAISQYLGRSVTTVQRWEAEEGLPVHRLPHKKRGSVYAYAAEIDAWLKLREESGGGGERLAEPAAPELPNSQWTKRRLSLIAAAAAGLALIPLIWSRSAPATMEGNAVLEPVTSYPGIEQHPHFSPDGRKLVFVWDKDQREYDLYLRDYASGEQQQLTRTAEREGSPRWSPDGRSIAFARYDSTATRKIFVMNLETREERLIATLRHARRQAIYAEWTPDGTALLVSDHDSAEDPLRIEKIAVSDGSRTTLTNPRGVAGDIYGNLSLDGKLLAFARCREEQGGCHLFVKEIPGGDERRLTSTTSAIWGLCWEDGSRSLIYSSGGAGRFELWRTGTAGVDEGQHRLSSQVGVAIHPSIRPGTQEVVFEHIIRQDHIWRMDLKQPEAARRPEQITRSTWSDYGPMLSPDGTQLAFASDQSGSAEVWVAAADGSGVARQLTRAGQARRSIYPSGWTPDGRAVSVYPLDAPADVEIGSGRSVAVSIDAKDPVRPHFWSRDGGTIFYFGWDNGRTNLWAKQVGSGRVVQLTRDRAATAAESFDGKTIYFSRYDQYPPGLWSVPVAGGEEKLVIPDARGDVWAVGRDGIYYFDFRDGSRNRYLPRDVSRYDFATGRTQRVARVTSNGTVNLLPGFAVSSDGRWIYWSQRDYQSSDIASLRLIKPH